MQLPWAWQSLSVPIPHPDGEHSDNDCDALIDGADTVDCPTEVGVCENVVVCTEGDGCCPTGCTNAEDSDCRKAQIICVDNADGSQTCTQDDALCSAADAAGNRDCGTSLSGCSSSMSAPWLAVLLGMVVLRRRRRS
ncbi:MAG: hypothetical protein R3C68_09080 [Myxococcota bacterium]